MRRTNPAMMMLATSVAMISGAKLDDDILDAIEIDGDTAKRMADRCDEILPIEMSRSDFEAIEERYLALHHDEIMRERVVKEPKDDAVYPKRPKATGQKRQKSKAIKSDADVERLRKAQEKRDRKAAKRKRDAAR